jgi:hypothetical protein
MVAIKRRETTAVLCIIRLCSSLPLLSPAPSLLPAIERVFTGIRNGNFPTEISK